MRDREDGEKGELPFPTFFCGCAPTSARKGYKKVTNSQPGPEMVGNRRGTERERLSGNIADILRGERGMSVREQEQI